MGLWDYALLVLIAILVVGAVISAHRKAKRGGCCGSGKCDGGCSCCRKNKGKEG